MNAPPTAPPQTFRYQKWGMLSTLATFVGMFAVLLWCLVDFGLSLRSGKSYVFDLFLSIILGVMLLLNGYMLYNRLGGYIELRDGKIRCMRWNGTIWQQGYLLNVVALEYVIPERETVPTMYVLRYPKFSIFFHREIENVEALIAEIEARTSKRFVRKVK